MQQTQPKTKQQPKYVELSPEEQKRVARTRRKNTDVEIEPEWMFIAEFGYFYGWGGVQAILNNEIPTDVSVTLLEAARRVFYKQNYHQANGTFAATVAAFRTKKPAEAFTAAMKGYQKTGSR